MPLLTKDQILNANDVDFEDVDCPKWGGTVRVRGLTGTERDRFEASMLADQKTGKVNYDNLRARLLAMCLVGDDGQRLFSDKEVADLGKKSAVTLDRVFDAARRLSGLSKEDVDQLGKISGGDRSDSSGSA